MTCESVRNSLSAHLDGQLPRDEAGYVASHLAGCRYCSLVSEQLLQLRGAMQSLPAVPPPEELTDRLRVMASRERSRRLLRKNPLGYLKERFSQWVEGLMRPVALPVAGGLVSTVVLFSMLVPSIALHRSAGHDVPTVLFTQATVKSTTPFAFSDDDFVVEVMVDDQGRMVDYWVAEGGDLAKNPEVRRSIENTLLFTEFTPATAFGQPTYSRIYLAFSRREIDVKS